jgi:hypothetical protein
MCAECYSLGGVERSEMDTGKNSQINEFLCVAQHNTYLIPQESAVDELGQYIYIYIRNETSLLMQ